MTAELSALAATNRPHPKTTNARSPQPQGKAPRSTTRSTIIEAQAADVMARSMTIIDKTTSCDDLVEACPPPFPTTSSHHDDWRFFPQDMPRECLLHCLTYLKAMELSALTQTCTLLNDHTLLQDVSSWKDRKLSKPDLLLEDKEGQMYLGYIHPPASSPMIYSQSSCVVVVHRLLVLV